MKRIKEIYPRRSDRKDVFEQFVLETGLSIQDLPFEYKKEIAGLHKPRLYEVSGFGGYTTMMQSWRIFVAYRLVGGDHVIQHSWEWNNPAEPPTDYKCQEFIQ